MWGRKSISKLKEELRRDWVQLRTWRQMMRQTCREQEDLVRLGNEMPSFFTQTLAARKENERALREQERMYRALRSKMRDLIRELARANHRQHAA